MTFDNVRLSASAIADLYRQSLVVVDGIQPILQKAKGEPVQATAPPPPSIPAKEPVAEIPVQPAKPVIHHTGGFKKEISIVINETSSNEIAPADLDMLKKLMTACKITMDDFAIINVAINQPAAKQLWDLMPAKVVLLFGVEYQDAGIPFMRPHFQVQNWSNALFMSAPPLADFQGANTPQLTALKRELWEGLQKVFLGK
jgi:hypothetical protein